jgi:molybdenum cofactor cytidylyltransferase
MAAGASSRMGRPKALLRIGDRSFVRHILETLQRGGIHEAVVVINREADAIREEVESAGFGRIVVNPRANEGQLSSLIAGLDAIDQPGVTAALVSLVDVPLVDASTIRLLLARAAMSPSPMLRAVHQGRHGHPVIFRRDLFEALRRADPAEGAKAVVRAVAVEDVEAGDPGVVDDVDTPEDYARLVGGRGWGN